MSEVWILLGEVGVDSGQLMVTDPCYVDSEWQNEKLTACDSTYIDTRNKEQHERPSNFEAEFEKGMTWNEAVEKGILVELKQPETGTYSYDGCCRATLNKSYGQLNYKMGHIGAGVVFNSGLGDGCYKVYGLFKDVPGWGRRIVEVKIKLLEE